MNLDVTSLVLAIDTEIDICLTQESNTFEDLLVLLNYSLFWLEILIFQKAGHCKLHHSVLELTVPVVLLDEGLCEVKSNQKKASTAENDRICSLCIDLKLIRI